MHVPKERTKVVIIIERFRIVGDMHTYPGARLLDIVNVKDTAFIPVTDAEIYSLADGKLIHKAEFIAVNRNAIKFFYPVQISEKEK